MTRKKIVRTVLDFVQEADNALKDLDWFSAARMGEALLAVNRLIGALEGRMINELSPSDYTAYLEEVLRPRAARRHQYIAQLTPVSDRLLGGGE